MNSASASRSIRYSISSSSSVDLNQQLRHAEDAARSRGVPHRGRCNLRLRAGLRATQAALGGRQPAGLARPPLDAAPAPNGRAAELAERLREAGAAREHVDALRGDAQALRDVDRDHELGARIDLHERTVALYGGPVGDAVVRVVRRSRAAAPQAEMPCSRAEGEPDEQSGVAAAPVVVEVRCGRADPHELDVHVQPVADAKHVAEQAAVLIHGVCLRLPVEADKRAGREEALRDRRCLRPVALG